MASFFRNLFQPKAPAPTAVAPEVTELFNDATRVYDSKDFERAIPLYDRVVALQPGHAEAYYKRGNALKNVGRLEAALASYDAAVEHKPDFSYAWCNRGVVQRSLASFDAALASFDRAIELAPTDAVAHSNRASLLQALSRWREALVSYDRLVALQPQSFENWFNRGNVLRELRQPQPALASYREALQYKPDSTETHYNCAVLLEQAQQLHAALASYDRAIAIAPDFHQAHYNRAGVLKRLEQPAAALAAYDRAIAGRPDYTEAHANRGALLQEMGRFAEALASVDRAIAMQPDHAEYHFNRSALLTVMKQWNAALASCDRVLALEPAFAKAHCQRAAIFLQTGRWTDALASFDAAVAAAPEFAEAQYNRSLALLLSGDYARGWLQYEWRWRNAARLAMGAARKFTQPLWLGKEALAGKRLLVYNEQGLGDTVQFCRFAQPVAALGAEVFLEVQAPLRGLLDGMEGVSQLIVEGAPLPEFDYRCPLLSLPLALDTTLDTIPAAVGYLRSDPTRVAQWRSRLGERRRPLIGLIWSGNPKHANDQNRSVPLPRWIEHLPRELDYVCLQKEFRASDAAVLAANPWIPRVDSELHDFRDTAALCESIDLVISVDTSVAHVSGALGRPTWVLLPFNPDWRWLTDRTDSPWYRSVKLFRQPAIGDWDGVFAQVAAELRRTFTTRA